MENSVVLVSVIMCAYNVSHEYFCDAVNSILHQDFSQFELLIVDDGSAVPLDISSFNDKRIKIFRNDKNRGISYSRNLAINKANGKYIAIMDADDIAEPNRLSAEFNFLENNPKCIACGTWFKQFGEKNSICKRIIDDSDLYKARLLFGNAPTLLDPSSMIRKSILDNNKIKYDENLKCGMDYLLWVRLTELGEIHNVKEILMNYRTHQGQITKQGYKHQDSKIIEYQLEKLNLISRDDYVSIVLEPLQSTKYSLKEYRIFLDNILAANEGCNYYNHEALKIAVEYQWHRKIVNARNVFYLVHGFFTVKNYKKSIIKSFLRHFGLFKNLDKIVGEAN